MNGYVSKPIDPEELFSEIDLLWTTSETIEKAPSHGPIKEHANFPEASHDDDPDSLLNILEAIGS